MFAARDRGWLSQANVDEQFGRNPSPVLWLVTVCVCVRVARGAASGFVARKALAALLKRIQRDRGEQIRHRQLDSQRLIQRNKNLKAGQLGLGLDSGWMIQCKGEKAMMFLRGVLHAQRSDVS